MVQKFVLVLIPAMWNLGNNSAQPLEASVTAVYMYLS